MLVPRDTGWLLIAAAAIVAVALTGCTTDEAGLTGTGSTSSNSSDPASVPSAIAMPSPVPSDGGIGAEVTDSASGVILPNVTRTPGDVNPNVTQSTIQSTICVTGWTATIRPPAAYTTKLKEQQLASGYAHKGDMATSDYEEDHLISLELGGSPTSPSNLWPEPYSAPDGASVKDQVENKLRELVCAGTIQLAAAQQAIAANWWIAYGTYVLEQQPQAVTPVAPAAPDPASVPGPAAPVVPPGTTAKCNDGTYSSAAHHSGQCSRHGGVAVFYS